jgi:membrane fusion protein (multidrug efflux system)
VSKTSRTAVRLALAVLLAGTAPVACSKAKEEARDTGRPVVLTAVEAQDLDERIEATGELVAKERAEVAAEVGGQVTGIAVDEGSAVSAGEVVLEIDPERRRLELDTARAQLAEAQANLAESERTLKRSELLRSRAVESEAKLDEVQTAVATGRARADQARAQLGVAERALRDATVVAPFAGLVARRLVSRGDYVSVGKPLFELVSLDPIEVEFHVSEVDSGRVTLDRPVDVRVSPHPDEVFQGRVTMVAPTIDPKTRTLRVKALLPNAEGRLRPGLFARVDLGVAQRHGVLMAPEEALLQRSDGTVVFRLLPGNRVERIRVETGTHRGGLVQITQGVAAGDQIVLRGHSALADGSVVSPRAPDDASVAAEPRGQLGGGRGESGSFSP